MSGREVRPRFGKILKAISSMDSRTCCLLELSLSSPDSASDLAGGSGKKRGIGRGAKSSLNLESSV